MADNDPPSRRRRDIKGDARRERILALLQTRASGDFTVEELADELGVSFATVRRDLNRMRELGSVARTYGGVALMQSAEVPARDRTMSHRTAKDAIGALAASVVEPGEVIIVDAGTTTARFAAHLSGIAGLTIITNGIGVINSVLEHPGDIDDPGPEVIVLGGQLRGINETIAGGAAEEMLRGIRATRAFMGTDAIDPERGIATRTFAQSRLKTLMMRSAQDISVLADSSKLDGGDFNYWSALPSSWTLFTDSNADEEALEHARSAGATDIRTAAAPAAADTATKED